MVRICLEAVLQMELQSVLGKGEALLNDMPLLDAIAHHLQSVQWIDLIHMVEETFKGTTGTSSTDPKGGL